MDENLTQRIDNLERKLDLFLDDYYRNTSASAQTITKSTTFSGGVTFPSSSVTLGSTGASLGFYGVTPVSRAGAISAPATPDTSYLQSDAVSAVNAINAIRAALTNIGITA